MAITESTQRPAAVVPFPAPRRSHAHRAERRGPWAAWRARRRFRTDLARLLRVAPHMIEDIGLTLAQARREAAKPFWRA